MSGTKHQYTLLSVNNADENYYLYPVDSNYEYEEQISWLFSSYIRFLKIKVDKDQHDCRGYYAMSPAEYRRMVSTMPNSKDIISYEKLVLLFTPAEEIRHTRKSSRTDFQAYNSLWKKIIEKVILTLANDESMYDEVKLRALYDEEKYKQYEPLEFYSRMFLRVSEFLNIDDPKDLNMKHFRYYAPSFTPLWMSNAYGIPIMTSRLKVRKLKDPNRRMDEMKELMLDYIDNHEITAQDMFKDS